MKLYFDLRTDGLPTHLPWKKKSTPSVSKALRIIICYLYFHCRNYEHKGGHVNNLHNLHSFHFVFAKAVLLRCPAKLGSPWLMMPFQLERDGPGTTMSFWFTRLRKSILHSGETSVENIYWKLVRDFLFALHLTSETWLVWNWGCPDRVWQ